MAATINTERTQVQWASGLNVLAGVWLFISAFVVYAHGPMMTNNVICGIAIAVLAAIRAFGAIEEGWLSWLNVLIGAWVIISPWAIMDTGPTAPTQAMIINNVITGGVMIILGGWSAIASGIGPDRATYPSTVRPPNAR